MAITITSPTLSACSYAQPEDMVKRFGLQEVVCATDKSKCGDESDLCPGNESYDRLVCALNDALAYLNQKLCCCFDAKKICDQVKLGTKFPILNFWQVTIARYYLHDVVSFSDSGKNETEQYRRYKQVLTDIKTFCDPKCKTVIVDETGDVCIEKTCDSGFAVAERKKSCIPDYTCGKCGCLKNNCCCKSAYCDDVAVKQTSYIGGKD